VLGVLGWRFIGLLDRGLTIAERGLLVIEQALVYWRPYEDLHRGQRPPLQEDEKRTRSVRHARRSKGSGVEGDDNQAQDSEAA
jgi:hypothetical protein